MPGTSEGQSLYDFILYCQLDNLCEPRNPPSPGMDRGRNGEKGRAQKKNQEAYELDGSSQQTTPQAFLSARTLLPPSALV